MEFIECPDSESGGYFELDASHMFINTKNPFNRVYSDLQCRVSINHDIGRPTNEFGSDPISSTPRDLFHEIIRNIETNSPGNGACDDIINRILDNFTQTSDLVYKPADPPCHYPSCSRKDAVAKNNSVLFSYKEQRYDLPTGTNSRRVEQSLKQEEKSTYCRPASNIYDQVYIYKLLRSNARLQRLVQRLVLARKKDKQDAWNNYINKLKNKHQCQTDNLTGGEDNTELFTEWGSCKPLHRSPKTCDASHNTPYSHSSPTQNDKICYPISSQGRFMMLNKLREKSQFGTDIQPRPSNRYYRGSVILTERDKMHRKLSKKVETQDEAVQTSFTCICDKKSVVDTQIQTSRSRQTSSKDISVKEENKKVSKNIEELKKKVMESDEQQQKHEVKSLSNIEGKIDSLLKSVNQFLYSNVQKPLTKNTSTTVCDCNVTKVELRNSNKSCERVGSKCTNICGNDKNIFYSMVQGGTRSAFTLSDTGNRKPSDPSSSKLQKILKNEVDKNSNMKEDIETLLKLQKEAPCSFHITFDMPTKDTCTVTHSLSKTKLKEAKVEKIGRSGNSERHMTIAVNTDPLSVLALLRVSADTVKQILSYMPQIDYYSYLSMLQFPQVPRNGFTHYVCNICGAAFGRPSQLTDHIQQHNLGNTRDCCVCRHMVDSSRRRLYCCEYCGQRFTRAYCCDLHQQACARRLGKNRDVSSSHILLK